MEDFPTPDRPTRQMRTSLSFAALAALINNRHARGLFSHSD
eukprot:CAMPEP_0185789932 /NCGR_PEP_ID=MMETSP1174-20130828/153559_1 /TAXON_ID=35687 /ORGANISM="Dictyocha speculum, Strain CCMP1381" /LENGTH=40 /DNA_ID= /DNA_START= /DNA_END= /DNA_ORIENTATION=